MFSVVIPAYNCSKTIKRVLDSVFSQTRKDLIEEIIIINDGSTDSTDQVIKDYMDKRKGIEIQYELQSNHGASYTRNKAIRKAKGEWIALLDADDIWLANKIERQSEIINRMPDMVFLGSHYPVKFIFRRHKSGLYKLSAKLLCIRSMPTTPSVVFKKEIGIELGLYNERMRYCEDINFFQKFLLKDSYYILAEKLVDISIGKKYTAQSGVSSNLKKMAKGRDFNTVELQRMGLITKRFMMFMLFMNQIKYVKRLIQNRISALIFR